MYFLRIFRISGEKLCQGEFFFKCRDGGCISKSLVCDNEGNCLDASDESDELCGENSKRAHICDLEKQFECNPGVCIPKKYVCNGEKNCLNGQDEDPARCSKMNVSYNFFKFGTLKLRLNRFKYEIIRILK